jgi:peptide methionine sulfoxide reductase MsrA
LANNGSLQNEIVVGTTCSKVFLLSVSTETLVFDAGCFRIVEAAFRHLPRVIPTETGYAGGITTSPTYRDVCERETQDAEVIKEQFDPVVLKAPNTY